MAAMIIGVSGFANSGKDTLADYLVTHCGFYKVAMAEPLKRVCQEVFDFTRDQLWGPSASRELPDTRYPLSGVCPHCQRECRPVDDYDTPGWWCGVCRRNYGEYLTPRLALQTLGTEWGRTLHRDVWVRWALREISHSDHDRWVIPDIRFRNEVAAVRLAGGHLVRLLRGEVQHSHASEAEMATMDDALFDCVIANLGDKSDLYKSGRTFVREIEAGTYGR